MSEIPEDILKAAEACYFECEQMDSYGIIDAIARAILAERQKWSAYLQSVVDPKWQPIETASAGILLLYFPAITGRNANTEMIRVDHFPVAYPRKPSHWMALPSPPKP